MDETTIMVTVCVIFIIVCVIIIVIGLKQYKRTPFKVYKRMLSDGSVQLEVPRFGNKHKMIMGEFEQKYQIGNNIHLDGREYIITDMKKIRRDSLTSSQYVMNIYLEDIKRD